MEFKSTLLLRSTDLAQRILIDHANNGVTSIGIPPASVDVHSYAREKIRNYGPFCN